MYIPQPYFKLVPLIGDLTLDHIIVADDYPILFTCFNKKDSLYLCLCYNDVGKQEWVIAPITVQGLEQLINDQLSIYDAFKLKGGTGCLVSWDPETNYEQYSLIDCSLIDDSILPSRDELLDLSEEQRSDEKRYILTLYSRFAQQKARIGEELLAKSCSTHSRFALDYFIKNTSFQECFSMFVSFISVNYAYSSKDVLSEKIDSLFPLEKELEFNIVEKTDNKASSRKVEALAA